jgi:hypothetical protein
VEPQPAIAPDTILDGGDPTATDPARQREADAFARQVAEAHKRAKERRRSRDLVSEKFMLHIGGEGDDQWYDVVDGSSLAIRPNLDGSVRCATNLLWPIVDNTVAYHTATPYGVIAESTSDRQSRDRARIDTIWANTLIKEQRWNELFAEALYLAMAWGFCPVHASWRYDLNDLYHPLYARLQQQAPGAMPGHLDNWVGDPSGTFFNTGATKRSIQWSSYERTVSLQQAQSAFGHVPGIEKLKGRKDLPSASVYQRKARKWARGTAGSSVYEGQNDGDETVALICRELAPGIDPQWPEGRLSVVALSGKAEAEDGIGTPFLLHDDVLPGKRFSFVRVYSANARFDDPAGVAWVGGAGGLDDLQVRANQQETDLVNGGIRAARPMLGAAPGAVEHDSLAWEPDGIVDIIGNQMPGWLKYPTDWMPQVREQWKATQESMFRKGGWQASSRGETQSGTPYSAIVTLQNADDSVHGPINKQLQGAICELLQISHTLTRAYAGPFPIPVQTAGPDAAFLAESYVYAQQLSEEPPRFTMSSGIGGTKEQQAQALLQLVGMKGADGEPLLRTRQFKKQYPDASMWPVETDVQEIMEQRAQAINYRLRDFARRKAQENPQLAEMPAQWLKQVAAQLYAEFDAQYPILRDDPTPVHLAALSELTQDVTEDPLCAALATVRQDFIYQWQQEQFDAQQQAAGQPQQPQQQAPQTADGGRAARPTQGGGAPQAQGAQPAPNAVGQRVTPVQPVQQAGGM